jgi:hypothetical protein
VIDIRIEDSGRITVLGEDKAAVEKGREAMEIVAIRKDVDVPRGLTASIIRGPSGQKVSAPTPPTPHARTNTRRQHTADCLYTFTPSSHF